MAQFRWRVRLSVGRETTTRDVLASGRVGALRTAEYAERLTRCLQRPKPRVRAHTAQLLWQVGLGAPPLTDERTV